MYGDIGKKVSDFFKLDNYRIQRTTKVEINGDKVKWSLENKLTNDGKMDSELKATHDFEKESTTLTISNKENPKFELKTKRFANNFDLSMNVKDPVFEVETKVMPASKLNFLWKNTWNARNSSWDSKLDTSYVGFNNVIVGSSETVAIEPGFKTTLKDYNFGIQYTDGENVCAVSTEKALTKLKLQMIYKLRENYLGYGEIIGERSTNNVSWNVGLNNKLNDTSYINCVVRHDYTMSFLYGTYFTKAKINGQICSNYDYNAKNATVEWKVVFSS